MWVRSLWQEDPLEERTATHSSTLAWRIPWTKKPGGLQSMGSQSLTWQATWHACTHTESSMYYFVFLEQAGKLLLTPPGVKSNFDFTLC